jgi:hypothetical protein
LSPPPSAAGTLQPQQAGTSAGPSPSLSPPHPPSPWPVLPIVA